MYQFVASQTFSMGELAPELTLMSVQFFHGLFVPFCLETSSSTVTAFAILAVDLAQAMHTTYDLLGEASWMRERVFKLNACSPEFAEKIGAADLLMQTLLGLAEADDQLVALHDHKINVLSNFRRHRDNSRLNRSRLIDARQRDAMKAGKTFNDSDQVLVEKVELLHHGLRVLARVEKFVLLKYIEIFVPCIYALYLAAISQSPNHVYYPAIASLDAGALTRVVSQLLGYAGLELVSLIVMLRVLRRRLRFSAFHQLGFVLVVQKMLIHGKLVGYLLSILQLPLTHAGIDFTLRFVWIHNATEST